MKKLKVIKILLIVIMLMPIIWPPNKHEPINKQINHPRQPPIVIIKL